MNAPLSRYLARFSTEPAIVSPAPAPVPEPTVTLTVGDLDARLEDTRRSAHAAGEAMHATALAEMEARHAEALSAAATAARAERTAAEADALATQVEAAFAALHERLADVLAKVLRPIVGDAVRTRTLDALRTALARLTDDSAQPAIALRAPADIVAALQGRGVPAGIVLVAADVAEAVAVLDGTRIETRLAGALADIEEV